MHRFLVVAVSGAVFLGLAAPAQAAFSCSYDPLSSTLTVTTDESASLHRSADSFVLYVPNHGDNACGGATIHNTDQIEVQGTPAISFELDMGDGAFAPGATPEADRSSEIEVDVHDPGTLQLALPPARTSLLYAGDQGLSWTKDDDPDITVSGLDRDPTHGGGVLIIPWPDAATFKVSGQGGHGTGVTPIVDKLMVEGHYLHAGRVIATGGAGPDRMIGSLTGQNKLSGAGGNDELHGGPLADILSGGAGNDIITGGAGADSIKGGDGDDAMTTGDPEANGYDDGANDRVDGGRGTDTASVGDADTTRRVEHVIRGS
jgi:hypothetical protein